MRSSREEAEGSGRTPRPRRRFVPTRSAKQTGGGDILDFLRREEVVFWEVGLAVWSWNWKEGKKRSMHI